MFNFCAFLCDRLSGFAAVKSKNVCLQLVDNHTDLINSGVVQLFTQPHPQKIIPSPYWGKVPPRLRSATASTKISKFSCKNFENTFLKFSQTIVQLQKVINLQIESVMMKATVLVSRKRNHPLPQQTQRDRRLSY